MISLRSCAAPRTQTRRSRDQRRYIKYVVFDNTCPTIATRTGPVSPTANKHLSAKERQRLARALTTIGEQRELQASAARLGLDSASWQLLLALAEVGPAGVGELARTLGRQERASVSRALARLRRRGLVRVADRPGRYQPQELTGAGWRELKAFLAELPG